MILIDLRCSHLRKTISCLYGTGLQLTSTAARAIVARLKTPSLSEKIIFLYGNPKTYNTSLDGTGKCWSSMWSVCQEELGMIQKSGPNVSNVRVKPPEKKCLILKKSKTFQRWTVRNPRRNPARGPGSGTAVLNTRQRSATHADHTENSSGKRQIQLQRQRQRLASHTYSVILWHVNNNI